MERVSEDHILGLPDSAPPTSPQEALAANPKTVTVLLLPLAENVVFPKSVYPLTLQGEQAESLVQAAEKADHVVALFLQREGSAPEPSMADLHPVGTLARLCDVRQTSDGLLEATAEGIAPVRLLGITQWTPHVLAQIEVLPSQAEDDRAVASLARRTLDLYRSLLAQNPAAAETIRPVLDKTHDPLELAYLVASTIPISPAARQLILETRTTAAKLLQLLPLLKKAHELAAGQISQADQSAEENSPTRAIAVPTKAQSLDQAVMDRIELENRLRSVPLTPVARRATQRELDRLSLLTSTSPDYNLVRTYLQWLADLPWQGDEEPEIDLDRARAILDRDHYGLDEIKQRIIEHLAVRKLRRDRSHQLEEAMAYPAQPVLCLVGPPGVGKTSLGRSIAEALGKPFVRISLGGVSDEAEIRGHRRTYLGSMPGRVIQSLVRAESNQPVMMLDELDKMGTGTKGDPTAALLDVLDPEQQAEFVDHYVDVPFDISSIFFIATANALDSVPEALRDRLEVIRLSGYTEEEKLQIAMRHLIPKQMAWHALTDRDVTWQPGAALQIIRSYTREAGVRQLEREIATVCRRVAMLVAQDSDPIRCPYTIHARFVAEALGTPRFLPAEPEATDQPGIVTGVFWTPVGGDIMHIEALMMPGHKTLTITGQLGEVMRESAQTALSYVRARSAELGVRPDFYERHDIHLHIPSGAVPKDGPSAGVALAVAVVSLLTDTAVSGDVAMTGEITLRGRVLPVGGIKEKVLAARRAGIHKIIMPAQNRRDLDDVRSEILQGVKIVLADTMDEVLLAAFPMWRGKFARAKNAPRKRRAGPRATLLDVPGAAKATPDS